MDDNVGEEYEGIDKNGLIAIIEHYRRKAAQLEHQYIVYQARNLSAKYAQENNLAGERSDGSDNI